MSDMVNIDFSDIVMMEVLEHLIAPVNSAWNHELNIQEAYREAQRVSKKGSQPLPTWESLGTTLRDLWRERFDQTQRDYATGSGSESNRIPDPVSLAFRQAAIRMAPKRNLRQMGAEDVDPPVAHQTEVANHMVDEFLPSSGEVKTASEVKTATNLTVHTPGSSIRKKARK